MNRREKDLQKALKYARLLGIRIFFRDILGGDIAGLYEDGDEDDPPKIWISRNRTLTAQLFTVLHELGHHLDFLNGTSTEREAQGYNLVDEKGHKAPMWAKKMYWNSEERANAFIPQIAGFLGISLPDFLYNYDLEKSRKYLLLGFKKPKITDKIWTEEKRKLSKRLRGKNGKRKKTPRS